MNRAATRLLSFRDAGASSASSPESVAEEREAAALGMVRRRPCTTEQVTEALRIAPTEAQKHLNRLCQDGLIERWRAGGQVIYRAVSLRPLRIRRPGRPIS